MNDAAHKESNRGLLGWRRRYRRRPISPLAAAVGYRLAHAATEQIAATASELTGVTLRIEHGRRHGTALVATLPRPRYGAEPLTIRRRLRPGMDEDERLRACCRLVDTVIHEMTRQRIADTAYVRMVELMFELGLAFASEASCHLGEMDPDEAYAWIEELEFRAMIERGKKARKDERASDRALCSGGGEGSVARLLVG